MQQKFYSKKISKTILTIFLFFLVLAAPAVAQTLEAKALTTVSAASFAGTVAPDSLGTIFSPDVADNLWTARLGVDGQFPQELGGLRVEIGGRAVPLIFV